MWGSRCSPVPRGMCLLSGRETAAPGRRLRQAAARAGTSTTGPMPGMRARRGWGDILRALAAYREPGIVRETPESGPATALIATIAPGARGDTTRDTAVYRGYTELDDYVVVLNRIEEETILC